MSTPCRVFLVGEGPQDIGDLSHHPSYRNGKPRRHSCLPDRWE